MAIMFRITLTSPSYSTKSATKCRMNKTKERENWNARSEANVCALYGYRYL